MWMMGDRTAVLLNFNSLCQINTFRFHPNIPKYSQQDSGFLLSPLTELKRQTEEAAINVLIYFMLARQGKVRSHKATGEGKEIEKEARERTHFISFRGQEVKTEWERWFTNVQSHTNPMDQLCYSVEKEKKKNTFASVEQVQKLRKAYVCAYP